jgi:hypothetical protein
LYPQDSFGFIPEFIEVIIFAFRRAEHMDDNIAVIQQNPAGIGRTFNVMRQGTFFFNGLFYFVADRTGLPGAFSITNNKVIRKTALLAYIQ